MWYVNSESHRYTDGTVLSFILTMWYVNLLIKSCRGKKMTSFILTMWYVNFTILIHTDGTAQSFYINYVICKSKSRLYRKSNSI